MFARPKSSRSIRLTAGLLTGLALVCLSGLSAAARPRALGQSKELEPQKVSNAQLRQALHVLQATKKTLQGADHDYGGHRVKAIEAINAAEKQLRLALGSQANHKKPANPGGKPPVRQPEPQNISNLQLQDAIGVLQKTVVVLEKADRDYGGHRVQAIKDLKVAIKQLNRALEFEKK